MKVIAEQLNSKKFRGMLIGIGMVIAAQFGLDEAAAKELIPWLVTVVCTYIASQGLADLGKAQAKLDLQSIMSTARSVADDMVKSSTVNPAKAAPVEDAPEEPAA